MGSYNEYVFCPHCGGITIPGICVNCGMSTEVKNKQEPVVQEQSETTGKQAMNFQTQSNVQQQSATNMQQPVNMQQQSMNRQQQAAFSRQQPDMSYTVNTPQKKSHWWIWLLIIGFVLFFGVILVLIAVVGVIFFSTSSNMTSAGGGALPQVQYEIDTSGVQVTVPETSEVPDEYATTVYGRELERLDFSTFDWDMYANSALVYSDTDDGSKDIYLDKEYQSTFGSNHDNHSINDFTGQYFEPFVDCIDPSYEYGLERHFVNYSNVDGSTIVNANIAYIQFSGDTIPNEAELNRRIMEMTMNDFWGHLDGQTSLYSSTSEITYMVDSFIPYNDDEKISILLDVNLYEDGYREDHYVYAINIDLVNGEIMDNGSILEIDETFAAMFRERNNAQNGEDVMGVINADDAEIAELLSSPETNIVFFSPYGMEVGYNYQTANYTWGWVSITLSDYEDYLK